MLCFVGLSLNQTQWNRFTYVNFIKTKTEKKHSSYSSRWFCFSNKMPIITKIFLHTLFDRPHKNHRNFILKHFTTHTPSINEIFFEFILVNIRQSHYQNQQLSLLTLFSIFIESNFHWFFSDRIQCFDGKLGNAWQWTVSYTNWWRSGTIFSISNGQWSIS